MLIGYMRVSTAHDRQSTDLQRDALVAAHISLPRALQQRPTMAGVRT